jgi:hypothetical protein
MLKGMFVGPFRTIKSDIQIVCTVFEAVHMSESVGLNDMILSDIDFEKRQKTGRSPAIEIVNNGAGWMSRLEVKVVRQLRQKMYFIM